MIQKITKFLKDARTELRHVNWPTPAEAARLTGIVIALCVVLAVFLGAFDYIFVEGLRYLIAHRVA